MYIYMEYVIYMHIHTYVWRSHREIAGVGFLRQHTSAHASIRTSADVSIRQHTLPGNRLSWLVALGMRACDLATSRMLLVLLGVARTTSGGSRSGGARLAATLAQLVALIEERRRGRQALVLRGGARTSSPETPALPVVKLVVKLQE